MNRVLAALLGLAFLGSFAAPAAAHAPDRRVVAELRAASTLEAQAEKTTKALNILLRAACFHARALGHGDDVEGVCSDWEYYWLPTLEASAKSGKGIGDHKPLSDWLAAATVILYAALKDYPLVIEMLRLEDLVIFNYGIPVFFDPHASAEWCLELPDVPCRDEYREHGERVISSTSYWIAWGSCVGATWGAGAIGMICSPVGTLTEKVVLATVAPKISYRIWDRANAE
jgi:hypothetical protein